MYTYVKLYMCILQGYQGPGGLHDWSPTSNNSHCIGGITGYIDKVQHISQQHALLEQLWLISLYVTEYAILHGSM